MKRVFVEDGTVPFIELDSEVTLNPGAVVFLTNRHEDMVGLYKYIGLATGYVLQTAVLFDRRNTFKQDALQLTVFMDELFWGPVVDDGDAFVHGIFFFPIACFHHVKCATNHHGYGLCA